MGPSRETSSGQRPVTISVTGAVLWIGSSRTSFHGVPLMEGHQDAKMMTMYPEANWIKGLFTVVNGLDEQNKPLTGT